MEYAPLFALRSRAAIPPPYETLTRSGFVNTTARFYCSQGKSYSRSTIFSCRAFGGIRIVTSRFVLSGILDHLSVSKSVARQYGAEGGVLRNPNKHSMWLTFEAQTLKVRREVTEQDAPVVQRYQFYL